MATSIKQHERTVLSLISASAKHLADHGIESPRLTAELLLGHALGLQRIELYMKFDQVPSEDRLDLFRGYIRRRLLHEPVQYIIGETQFMGLTLAVDPRVFIPRPETEVLVERTIEAAHAMPEKNLRILDIGTGSGNIAIALAHVLPNCTVDTLDVSEDALTAAQANANRNGVGHRVHALKLDILRQTPDKGSYDIIVSNPPYISQSDFELLEPEIKEYEPVIAATDHSDGFTFYRRIAEIASKILGGTGCVLVEVADGQSMVVESLLRQGGLSVVDTFQDYAGTPRVVKATGR